MNQKISKIEQLLIGKGSALKLEIESLNGCLCKVCRRSIDANEPLRIHKACLSTLSTNLCLDFLDMNRTDRIDFYQRLGVRTEIQKEFFIGLGKEDQENFIIQTYMNLCKKIVVELPSSFYIENVNLVHQAYDNTFSFGLDLIVTGIVCCFICNSFHVPPRPWQLQEADPLVKSNLEGVFYHKECGGRLLKALQEGTDGSEIFK